MAAALEHRAAIRPDGPVRRRALSPEGRELRFCRCCYDHLAGQVGVAITRALQQRGFIAAGADRRFDVTAAGVEWFGRIGVDAPAIKPTRRGLARQCLDWTERSHHLAGPLGAHLMRALCARGWVRRSRSSRAVRVTPRGWDELRQQFGFDEGLLRAAS